MANDLQQPGYLCLIHPTDFITGWGYKQLPFTNLGANQGLNQVPAPLNNFIPYRPPVTWFENGQVIHEIAGHLQMHNLVMVP